MQYSAIEDVVKDLEENPAESGGHIYHPIPFPEFSHLKTSANTDVATFKLRMIEKTFRDIFPSGFVGKKLLDIGANCGMYSFTLADQGMNVTSFEPHSRYSKIGKFLAKEKGLDIDWHSSPFDISAIHGKKFDVCLMMSVFQWMASGGGNMKSAINHLGYISKHCSYLVFELGYNSGKSCLRTNKLNHYSELINFLDANTSYQNFELLGKTKAWGGKASRYMVLCSDDDNRRDGFLRSIERALNI